MTKFHCRIKKKVIKFNPQPDGSLFEYQIKVSKWSYWDFLFDPVIVYGEYVFVQSQGQDEAQPAGIIEYTIEYTDFVSAEG